jgi:hypothetical protein
MTQANTITAANLDATGYGHYLAVAPAVKQPAAVVAHPDDIVGADCLTDCGWSTICRSAFETWRPYLPASMRIRLVTRSEAAADDMVCSVTGCKLAEVQL